MDGADDDEGGGWDVDDDDLELPADLDLPDMPASEGEGYFVPPTKGWFIVLPLRPCYQARLCLLWMSSFQIVKNVLLLYEDLPSLMQIDIQQ